MTTRAKIDNLLNNSSDTYLDSMWNSLLNYHNQNDLSKFGYKLGETKCDLIHAKTTVVKITEILNQNDEQIMFLNSYGNSFELRDDFDKLFDSEYALNLSLIEKHKQSIEALLYKNDK